MCHTTKMDIPWNESHPSIYQNYLEKYPDKAVKTESLNRMEFNNLQESTDFFKHHAAIEKRNFFYQVYRLKTNAEGKQVFEPENKYIFSCGVGQLYQGDLKTIREELMSAKIVSTPKNISNIERGLAVIEQKVLFTPSTKGPAEPAQTQSETTEDKSEYQAENSSTTKGL